MVRSDNKQLAINIFSNICIYVLQFVISFLLTPFIVKALGVEAYGFVGLSNNIISYTTLITVALNAMASRFISIEYHKNNIKKANVYFSSVFYGNLILGIIMMAISSVIVLYLEYIVNIPEKLVSDVKILFILLSVNAILGIITSVFNIATFVKNRIDLRSIRTAIGNVLRALSLLIVFSVFTPKLWLLGISGMICTTYLIIVNIQYTRLLTPELKVNYKNFDWTSVVLLVTSGLWSLLTAMSDMFAKGFDLLLSNIFIDATSMGLLSLSMSIPMILQSICTSLSICFAPSWTLYYAKKDTVRLKYELAKSIRIMGFMSLLPLCILFSYGDIFYSLWLPTQDYQMIYYLTVIGCLGYIFAFPLDSVWEIFTVTNKVKLAAINLIVNNFMVFGIVMIGMFLTESNIVKLFILASTRSFMIAFRSLTFLPLSGAKLVEMKAWALYKPALKNLLSILIICIISILFKNILFDSTWLSFLVCCVITIIIGVMVSAFVTLNSSDREYLLSIIKAKLKIG